MRLLLLLSLALAARGNLLDNPGFESWEDDSTPAAWRVENRARTLALREPDTVRSGATALRLVRVELLSGNNFGVVQAVPVRGGAEYRYEVWVREEEPELRVGVGVSWRRADSSYISASRVRYSVDLPDWQVVADTLPAPAEAALAEFRIRCYAAGGLSEPRAALVDDARFGEPTTPAETTQVWFAQDSLALRLIDFFGKARYSLDYCVYNSSRPDVVEALIEARDRGARVRVITDDTRLNNDWVRTLRAAGIPVWTDSIGPGTANYMHNKFAVRDFGGADTADDRVWSASYNPNIGDLRADFAIELPHTGIARAYTAEFQQMWGDTGLVPNPERARFHRGKSDVLDTHRFELDGWPVEVYFGPQDRPVDTIAARARDAQQQILFAIFSYTHTGLGDAMIERWGAGVWVGGVIDRSGLNQQGAQYPRLVEAGIPVFEDSVAFGEKILHEKLMVIDSLVTVAGSVNWSGNGNERNDEALLVLHHPGLAQKLLAELHQRYWEATNPGVAEERGPGRPVPAGTTIVRGSLSLPESPAGARYALFDHTGRRVLAPGPGANDVSRLSPGVYFLRVQDLEGGSAVSRVVITR